MISSPVSMNRIINQEGQIVPELVLRHLTRSVNGVCYASEEEGYAAVLIRQLQQEVADLKAQVAMLQEKNQSLNGQSTSDQTTLDHINAVTEIDKLRAEYKRDGLRIAFCLQENLYSSGDYIVGHFEQELIVDGNYRTAIDRIMCL